MGDAAMDAGAFKARLAKLYALWKREPELFGGADVLVVVNGKADPDVIFRKTFALQLWLTGYELNDCAFLFTKNAMHVLSTKKKISMMGALVESSPVPLKLTSLSKDAKEIPSQISLFLKEISVTSSSSSDERQVTIGMIVKEPPTAGPLAGIPDKIKTIPNSAIADSALGFSTAMASRDDKELDLVRNAAACSDLALQSQILPTIESSLDEGVSVTHEKLAEDADHLFSDGDEAQLSKLFKENKLDLDVGEVESCFTPIVQSGGEYNLKPSAFSSSESLSPDCIIVATGIRYSTYCSSVARTYMINPDKSLDTAYNVLLQVRDACLETMRVGAKASTVWAAATTAIKASPKASSLLPVFTRNCGFLTGQEYRDSAFILNSQNENRLRANMVFILSVGFSQLKFKGKSAALLLSDTVVVVESGPAQLLTKSKCKLKDVSYFLDAEDDGVDDVDVAAMIIDGDSSAGPRTRSSRASMANKGSAQQQQEKEEKRKRAQQELAERKLQLAVQKYSTGQDREIAPSSVERSRNAVIKAYATVRDYPRDVIPNQIYVDTQAECVLFPVNGRVLPVHVTFIKSVTKHEQGDFTYLRVNLTAPGTAQAAAALPAYADQTKVFIKELSFRSADERNLNKTLRLVKELHKRIAQREKEQTDRASLVMQAPLKLNRDPRHDFKLRDLQMRPSIGGKKETGTLSTHVNGLLFTSRSTKLEFLYSNIKHAFFQPCDNTISVILHFELHSPIMCNKKRTNFVQVYVDVIEASQDVGGQKRGYYDRDGIQEEQNERIRRNRFNEKFREFARNVEDTVAALDPEHKFEFDIPYREIMFPGVPNKTNVNIIPTVHALVALDDNPPFVMFLDEVEIAYFERVQFSLKNFDLVFVFKDFDRPVVKIRSIPREHLDSIQQYLTESDIVYYVGKVNLLWPSILKTVKEDAAYFFTEQGGWASVLGGETDEDEEEEQESEYEEDESAESEDESSEEYESAEMSDEEESDYEDEEEGPSWEELEEAAMREEQEKVARTGRKPDDDDDEDRRPSKKARSRK